MKAYSKKAYNPESKKAASNQAYRNDATKKKAYMKRLYTKNAQAVLRRMRKYYYSYKRERRTDRCARYALKQPTPDRKQTYVREIQKQLMQSKVARDELLKAFKARYSSFAARKPRVSRQVVCGSASRQLLSKVLRKRQQAAGLLLQSIKSIKKDIRSFESEDDFGERCHTRSSEPYFFESAYCHVKCNEVFPVNEKGQLVIADCITDTKSDRQQPKTNGNIGDEETRPIADELTNSKKVQCTSANSTQNATSGSADNLGTVLSANIDDGKEAGTSGEGFASSTKGPQMSDNPTKYKCSYLCKPLTQTEIDAIVTLRQAFDRPVEQLRSVLQSCDEDCPNPHYQSFYIHLEADPDDPDIIYTYYLPRDLKGHSLLCSLNGNCQSKLRIIRAASAHYSTLRRFMRELHPALKHHKTIHKIDAALGEGDFEVLMSMADCKDFCNIFDDVPTSDDDAEGDTPSDAVPMDERGLRRRNLESWLQVKYATVIHDLQKQIDDYPLHACCSCERLHQRKSVTRVRLGDSLGDVVWPRLKTYLLEHSPDVRDDVLFMCNYCKPMIKSDKLPGRCVLNGLQTVPVPPELGKLDSLSSQLIQRAKCFQTVVRLGTYTSKVPVYNSLKACKGTMFFLPLPLSKTQCTLDLTKGVASGTPELPDPELYIIVNGTPTKSNVVWRSLVDVNQVKQALLKLKQINWLYTDVDDDSVDEAAKKVIEVVSNTSSTMLEKATTDEIDAFQAYTIRNLDKKLSTQPDIEQYKVLNVKEDPLSNRQKHLDVLCFPVLFPTGKFGEHHPREAKILPSEYAKARLLNRDSRFRKNPQYAFYLLWQKEMRELSSGVYNMLKSARASRPVSAAALLNQVATSDDQLEGNLSTVLRSVRGTKQFWFVKRSELRCMIREYGTPTLFLTFSCAEYESADITDYLRKVNNVPSSYSIGKLCAEDPLSVSRKFSLKFNAFFNTVICKASVLGEVEHFYWKKEYQARGAPHYHVLLWIRDAPVIGRDKSERVLDWIEARITCHIPDQKGCPELHRLVTRFQIHKCSAYCKRKRKVRGVFVTQCKFAFPRQVCESASLNDVESTLKSRKRIYQLARNENESTVNDYSPLLLLLWQANMDVQFVSESSLALAHYVSGYVTKAERSNMQDIWQEVGESKTVYGRLWNFGIRCLRSRECGLYEASDLLLGDHLYHKSVTVQWVDVSLRHKRNRRLKDYAEIQEMSKREPDSEDIFEEGLLDSHYPNRPKELEKICLFDFVANYDWYGRDDEGKRCYRKLTKPRLPNHRLFDPQKENQREDYYYSLILLFVPFRKESSLLLENETAEQAFNRLVPTSTDCSDYHTKLQKILQAESQVKKINEARQAADDKEKKTGGLEDGGVVNDDDIQLIGEAKTAMQEVLDMNVNMRGSRTTLSLEERVAMLNVDQRRVFDKVKSHLLHQQKHEASQCACATLKPLHMFVSGVGGTGKSFLIEAIRELVGSIWPSHDFTCAVVAPTGLAAFNIGGVTVHRLFHLPVEHEGKTAGYWPLAEDSRKVMKTTLRHVKVVIIDEVSMVSSLTLAYIHLRLEEIFGGEEWFGSTNMLFVGDILQLPPVNGQPVFEQILAKSLTHKLGCTTAVNIWRDSVVYDELTLNERQKKDGKFSKLLDSVRCGVPTEETLCVLRERVMRVSVVDKFTELQQQGLSPVCLFPTRKACNELNTSMLARLTSPTLEIACIDEVDETASARKWSNKAAEQLKKLNKDCNMTAGLEANLRLAVGARVMLRRNIDTKEGLVNGAIGTVRAVSASCVTVQFDHISEPYKVEMVKSRFMVMKNYCVYRKQFPLILAYAVTIHKCQGLSLDCAIVDLSQQVFSVGMAYVALSRVRTLEGLHLVAFDPKSIMVSSSSLKEVNRLRKTYRSDLPLYIIPSSAKTGEKRKYTAATLQEHQHMPLPPPSAAPLAKRHAGPRKATATVCRRKRKMTQQAEKAPPPKKAPPADREHGSCSSSSSAVKSKSDSREVERHRDSVSPYHYHPVDQEWQVNACSELGLCFVGSNRVAPGGPRVPLKRPDPRTIRRIAGDGNCLFRSFSYILTGSEDQHRAVRLITIRHMRTIAHLLIGPHIPKRYGTIEDYIRGTDMDRDSTWGTDVEMFTLAHLLHTSIYSYNTQDGKWWQFSPNFVDSTLMDDSTARAMYIRHPPGHFDVVCSIA